MYVLLFIYSFFCSQIDERYGYEQPDPLRKVLCWQKRQDVKRFLEVTGWINKTKDEVYTKCYSSII